MKCKGFTLDSENERKLTLTAYKKLLANFLEGKQESVEVFFTYFGYHKFSSDSVIFSEDRVKKLTVTVEKSVIDRTTMKTFPKGYEIFDIEIAGVQ